MNRLEELIRTVEHIAEEVSRPLSDDLKLRPLFKNCFVNTAKTTTKLSEDGGSYVFTGDIEAMWLRDSSAQVIHYLPFLNTVPILKEMVSGLLKKQIACMKIDPYANAFNEDANGNCWDNDITERSLGDQRLLWVWERKYEVDSICYPIWLLKQYWDRTGDADVFTKECWEVLHTVTELWKTEQNHREQSRYSFMRLNCPASDTLSQNGKGSSVAYTGMTWSGFRPSDDACRYHYLVPSNMFAVVILEYIQEFARDIYKDEVLSQKARSLRQEIEQGINRYGMCKTKKYGDIYAYEVDGLSNYNFMDDANVPSLLSIPWLGYRGVDDPVYKNTRAFILSKDNPYYYEGKTAKGIGSPHTPKEYIWHISLAMQGLTAESEEEKEQILKMLLATDGGTGYMHEGFHCEDPDSYTRPWFAWANSLFALFVMDYKKLI